MPHLPLRIGTKKITHYSSTHFSTAKKILNIYRTCSIKSRRIVFIIILLLFRQTIFYFWNVNNANAIYDQIKTFVEAKNIRWNKTKKRLSERKNTHSQWNRPKPFQRTANKIPSCKKLFIVMNFTRWAWMLAIDSLKIQALINKSRRHLKNAIFGLHCQ